MQEDSDPLEALEAQLDHLADSAARLPRVKDLEELSQRSLRLVNLELALDGILLALSFVARATLGWGYYNVISAGLVSTFLFNLIHRFELTHESLAAATRRDLLGQLSQNARLNRLTQGMWIVLSALLATAFLTHGSLNLDWAELAFGAYFALRVVLHGWRFRRFPSARSLRDSGNASAQGGPS